MSDEYKRQIDIWIKISLIATPLLSGAMSWGVIRTTINNLDSRLTRVETWVTAQTEAVLEQAKFQGETTEQAKEMNRRLERIEVILDSRLKR